ncbi:metallophosphoesterase [candidate division KSB1 bacterium]|nr:metallophosphoesterase [candidate division KSB1 bacterium]
MLIPLLAMIFFKMTGLYARGHRNFKALELTEHHIWLQRLPGALNGLRILQLSDLHLDLEPGFVGQIMPYLQRLDFDLCVLTGDYRWHKYGPIEPALAALRPLARCLQAPLGVYAILGNHDPMSMVSPLQAFGWKVLLNEAVIIERNGASFGLAGLKNPRAYGLDDIVSATAAIQPQAVKIILVHSPERFGAAQKMGYDLYLTGHTHGGQVCLPGGIPLFINAACPRRLVRGAWRYKNLQGYTSRGIGASGIPVRFNCPPEIIRHHLHAGAPPKKLRFQ